jgi:RNAse (barnase) inhibitor barstar
MSTDRERLLALGKPSCFITTLEDSAFANLCLQLQLAHPTSAIRTIRGKKSRTANHFFNEIAAAMQFPYYFGENGSALTDCITDLEWLPADAYLLAIPDAAEFLIDEIPDHFESVVQIFAAANEQWVTPNQYFPRDRQPTPFHVLFQCAEAELAHFRDRMQRSGVEAEVVDVAPEP